MVTGTVEMPSKPIKKENKKTWYRLHPNQDNPDFFGHVMVCPNLPNGAIVSDAGNLMSMAEMYRKKGFKETPQELNPNARLVRKGSEYYLIPEGYELKETVEKTLFGDGITKVDVTVQRVVKTVNEDDSLTDSLTCEKCGKVCKGEFGLRTHLRSHEK